MQHSSTSQYFPRTSHGKHKTHSPCILWTSHVFWCNTQVLHNSSYTLLIHLVNISCLLVQHPSTSQIVPTHSPYILWTSQVFWCNIQVLHSSSYTLPIHLVNISGASGATFKYFTIVPTHFPYISWTSQVFWCNTEILHNSSSTLLIHVVNISGLLVQHPSTSHKILHSSHTFWTHLRSSDNVSHASCTLRVMFS